MDAETIAMLAGKCGIAESNVDSYVYTIGMQNLATNLELSFIIVCCGFCFFLSAMLMHYARNNTENQLASKVLKIAIIILIIAAFIVVIFGIFNVIDWIFNYETKTITSLLGS